MWEQVKPKTQYFLGTHGHSMNQHDRETSYYGNGTTFSILSFIYYLEAIYQAVNKLNQ
jgi:hypothetical protein